MIFKPGFLLVVAAIVAPGVGGLCTPVYAKAPLRSIARESVPHVRGMVTTVSRDSYRVRDTDGSSARVEITAASHLFRLVPTTLSQARPGWAFHAIGSPNQGVFLTRMLVLFPPATLAGVPPPGSGMSGLGRVALAVHGVRLAVGSQHLRVKLTRSGLIVIARPMRLSALRVGDMAMAFGTRIGGGLRAAIVHVVAKGMR